MNIDDLKIGELKQLKHLLFGQQENHCPWEVGSLYLIRTVTLYVIGKLESVGDKELVLSSASWIADTGKFHKALKTGVLNEIEPFLENVIIGRGAIVDATKWRHDAPRTEK